METENIKMKTYFKYRGENVRIARDSGASQDRFTEQEIVDALESGDAVRQNDFILLTSQTDKIMGVFEDKDEKKLDFNNEGRRRYYGLRKGDIVELNYPDKPLAEVMNLALMDNNRVYVRIQGTEKIFSHVAEWCEIKTRVEDR